MAGTVLLDDDEGEKRDGDANVAVVCIDGAQVLVKKHKRVQYVRSLVRRVALFIY